MKITEGSVIPNQWYGILPSKAVKRGNITAVKRLNLELVLFRDNGGNLGCVVDQCTHRGAALSKGKMKGSCLQCPFHGLEFRIDGTCRFIPANGISSKEDISRYNVRHYAVKEAHDIIYLWFGKAEEAQRVLPFFEPYIDDSYVYSEMQDLWNSHYSRSIENQLDVVHLPFVHYNTIGRGNHTLVNGPKVIFEEYNIITSADNETDCGQVPRSADECEIKSTYLSFKYPNVWMNHISEDIKIMIYFAPVDEENTILYIRFYNRITKIRAIDRLIAWVGKFANRKIERQDKRVVITQQPKASDYFGGEHLLQGDAPIIQYRKIREELKKQADRNE